MKRANKTKLERLLKTYGQNKSMLDKLKKTVESENASIKSIMAEEDLSEYEHAGWIVKYIVQHRETMNDEALMDYLQKNVKASVLRDVIKSKPYIDYDALENAIYKENISEKIVYGMDKFREVKDVPTLKISKVKE